MLGDGATEGGSTITEWDQGTCDGHNTRRGRTARQSLGELERSRHGTEKCPTHQTQLLPYSLISTTERTSLHHSVESNAEKSQGRT